jgi:hypothetical protein
MVKMVLYREAGGTVKSECPKCKKLTLICFIKGYENCPACGHMQKNPGREIDDDGKRVVEEGRRIITESMWSSITEMHDVPEEATGLVGRNFAIGVEELDPESWVFCWGVSTEDGHRYAFLYPQDRNLVCDICKTNKLVVMSTSELRKLMRFFKLGKRPQAISFNECRKQLGKNSFSYAHYLGSVLDPKALEVSMAIILAAGKLYGAAEMQSILRDYPR